MYDLKKHKFVIFSEEHYNPLGIIRSLGEAGIKSIAIIIRNKIKLTSKSRYLQKVYYVSDREEGLKVLLTLANNEYKSFVYCSDDTTVSFFDNNYDVLKDNFYFFNVGKKVGLEYYLNKDNIGRLAIKHGLNFLESVVLDKTCVPDDIEYPIITKAIDSTSYGWKNDMFVCNSKNELIDAMAKIKSSKVLVQKYIVKKNEYCLEGFSVNQGNDVFISIESTYNYLLPMSYSPYMTVRNFSNKNNVFDGLKKMFKDIGFEGIFEVEFLEDETGKLYFGEINFRNSTWSYASTCAGMNLPLLWAMSMLDDGINKDLNVYIPSGEFTAMVELTDYKERVKTKQISFFA